MQNKKILSVLLTTSLIFPVFTVPAQAIQNTNTNTKQIAAVKTVNSAVKKQYNVFFKNEINFKLLSSKDIKILDVFEDIDSVTIETTSNNYGFLIKQPDVVYIEEDKKVKTIGQDMDWGMDKVRAPESWNKDITGEGVKVGVIDTGIQTTHPDLKVVDGISTVSYTSSYNDDNGHGTHVAGIIAGLQNNIGIVGVAPDVSLYAIKAMDKTGNGTMSDIARGIEWAIEKNLDVINLSLGSNQNSYLLQQAIDNAWKNGIVVVAAAGNEGGPVSYPAALPSAIAVSAIDSNYNIASFSNRGSKIEFAAPGVNILSTYINSSYANLNGTSMASPYVAGVMALYKQAYPALSNSELRNLAKNEAMDIGATGKDNYFGYGLIQSPISKDGSIPENPVIPEFAPDSPLNVTIDNVTDRTVTLSWDKSENASKYQVKINNKLVYDGSRTTFVKTGLIPNTIYSVEIVAINAKGQSQPTTLTFTTKPLSEMNFPFAAQPNKFSMELFWREIPYATKYSLYNGSKLLYSGTGTYFNHEGLQQNTVYPYVLKVTTSVGYRYEYKISARTLEGEPVKPTFNPTAVTASYNQISWRKLPNATSYRLKRDGNIIYEGNGITYKDTNISPTAVHNYTLVAMNKIGTSEEASVKVQSYKGVPENPINIKFAIDKNTSTLSWDKIDGVSYQILDGTKSLYKGAASTTVLRNLTTGSTYNLVIKAYNTAGYSSGESINMPVPQIVPRETRFSSTSVTKDAITLRWSNVVNVDTYELKRDGVTIYEGKDLLFIDKNIELGKQYVYTIVSKNSAGASKAVTSTVKSLPTLPNKMNIVKNALVGTTLTMSWDRKAGETYIITESGRIILNSSTNSITLKNLIKGKTYSFNMKAKNVTGFGEESVVTVTIP